MQKTPREINNLLEQINLFEKNNADIKYESEVNLKDGKFIFNIFRTKTAGKEYQTDNFVDYYNKKYNTNHVSATDIATESEVEGFVFHLIDWIADKKEEVDNPLEDFTGKLLNVEKKRERKLNI